MGLQDVHLRRLEPSYDGSAGVQPLTLTTLLAFQRQLATISTSFSPSNQHFSLVSLLFAEKGTQLRLDMRDRWFRRFPAGESTHALSISGYSFGDYVGSYASHQRELHWNLYAWPKDADSHTALCFHFQVKASRDERTLCVVVRVSQGAIDTTARRLVVLSTLSLREKLCLVPHWTPKHVVDWVYHRGSSVH